FNGDHRGAVRLRRQHGAALHCLPVHHHRACPAQRGLTAHVRSRQVQHVAYVLHQQQARLNFVLVRHAIHRNADCLLHGTTSSFADWKLQQPGNSRTPDILNVSPGTCHTPGAIVVILGSPFFSVSPCLRGGCSFAGFRDHSSSSSFFFFRFRPSRCNRSNSVFSSITSSGHSGQLCSQHTIKSHLLGSCPCARKFRLSFSNSMCTLCHTPGATSRMASQSGK